MSKDLEYLGKLRDYYASHRILPSFAGIGTLVGMKSKSAVSAMVKRLMEAGFLDYAPDRRLQPGKAFFEREILGSVRAGLPQPANDSPGDVLTIDEYLIETPSRTVLLSIKGDSMVDAGLLPGDTVVVKKGAPSKAGDIVVAIVDNEFTVKYLAHDKAGFFLKPGNRAYPPIRPHDHLEIFGLVVGSFRKY
ncbi:MAG: LexA family transcriptional regulator [Sulfuricella sp.]|nr:LexA family transcriptional regulator [Sulfuricella sp.]